MGSRFARELLWLVLITALLAACGQKAPATAPPRQASNSASSVGLTTGEIDPCALLTKEDVTEVLGKQLRDVKLEPLPRPNCNYPVEPGEGKINIFVFTEASAAASYEYTKTKRDENAQPVAGVGTDAYWSPNMAALMVLKGKTSFSLAFSNIEGGTVDAAKALALKVANRLP